MATVDDCYREIANLKEDIADLKRTVMGLATALAMDETVRGNAAEAKRLKNEANARAEFIKRARNESTATSYEQRIADVELRLGEAGFEPLTENEKRSLMSAAESLAALANEIDAEDDEPPIIVDIGRR